MRACPPPHRGRPLPQHSGALQTRQPGLAPRKGSGARTSWWCPGPGIGLGSQGHYFPQRHFGMCVYFALCLPVRNPPAPARVRRVGMLGSCRAPQQRPGQEPHTRAASSEVYSWSVFLICEALPHSHLHHSANTWTSVQLIIPVCHCHYRYHQQYHYHHDNHCQCHGHYCHPADPTLSIEHSPSRIHYASMIDHCHHDNGMPIGTAMWPSVAYNQPACCSCHREPGSGYDATSCPVPARQTVTVDD